MIPEIHIMSITQCIIHQSCTYYALCIIMSDYALPCHPVRCRVCSGASFCTVQFRSLRRLVELSLSVALGRPIIPRPGVRAGPRGGPVSLCPVCPGVSSDVSY